MMDSKQYALELKARVKSTGQPPTREEIGDLYDLLGSAAKRRVAYYLAEQITMGHVKNVLAFRPQEE